MAMVTHGGQRSFAIFMVPNTCTERLNAPGQHVCEPIQALGARIRHHTTRGNHRKLVHGSRAGIINFKRHNGSQMTDPPGGGRHGSG